MCYLFIYYLLFLLYMLFGICISVSLGLSFVAPIHHYFVLVLSLEYPALDNLTKFSASLIIVEVSLVETFILFFFCLLDFVEVVRLWQRRLTDVKSVCCCTCYLFYFILFFLHDLHPFWFGGVQFTVVYLKFVIAFVQVEFNFIPLKVVRLGRIFVCVLHNSSSFLCFS